MKILATVGFLLALVVASVSMCGYKLFNMMDEFPADASVENLNEQYAQLVAKLNSSIASSNSALSLAAILEKISYPPETLFVALQKEGGDELTVFDRRKTDSGSKVRVIMNGGGYGRTNEQHYLILQHSVNKYEYEHIELWFEREVPNPEGNSDSK